MNATATAETTESTVTSDEPITGPWAEFDKDDCYTGSEYYRCEVYGAELLASIVRDVGFEHTPYCPVN